MGATLRIGTLYGGGLVLGYRCSCRCRHCLYGCGPHRRDGEPDSDAGLEALLDLLAERAPRARLHIGGGEPFLDLDRLEAAVSGMRRRRLALDYVETNASWVRSPEHAEQTLERLARAGLGQVLVSLSPFHAEFVAPARTAALVEVAERVLPGGAFVWIPSFARDLAPFPADRPIDLQGLLRERGDAYALDLTERYSLVPAGRTGRFLWSHGARTLWRRLLSASPCAARLADTSHFHVDCRGLYVPGLCAGIALPLDEVPGAIDPARYPAIAALATGGVAALVELARGEGFEPAETYASACDLCTHARFSLFARGFAGLGPAGFYEARSVPGFEEAS